MTLSDLLTVEEIQLALGGNWQVEPTCNAILCGFTDDSRQSVKLSAHSLGAKPQQEFNHRHPRTGDVPGEKGVGNLGEEAYWTPNSGLDVRQGDVAINVLAHTPGKWDEDQSTTIAKIVIKNLIISQGGSVTPDPTRPPTAAPTPVPTPRYDLAINSFTCTYDTFGGSTGFAYVEGEVTNISTQKLENVMAVGTWYTADDTLITSDEALLDFNPILSGQTSPFKTFSTYNPAMDHCTLRFRYLFGGEIAARDDRAQ